MVGLSGSMDEKVSESSDEDVKTCPQSECSTSAGNVVY